MIDRRRYERVPFFCQVGLAAGPAGRQEYGRSIDLSQGGVGVMTPASFAKGQLVTVTFFLRDGRQQEVRNQMVGRIVSLQADMDANRVGVEFLQPLDKAVCPELMRKLVTL